MQYRGFLRGSSAADIRKWENEIVSEATRTKEIPSDNNGDWWINIFNKVTPYPMYESFHLPIHMWVGSTCVELAIIFRVLFLYQS